MRLMTKIFGDQNFLTLLCYLDDILVFAPDEGEALRRLESVQQAECTQVEACAQEVPFPSAKCKVPWPCRWRKWRVNRPWKGAGNCCHDRTSHIYVSLSCLAMPFIVLHSGLVGFSWPSLSKHPQAFCKKVACYPFGKEQCLFAYHQLYIRC